MLWPSNTTAYALAIPARQPSHPLLPQSGHLEPGMSCRRRPAARLRRIVPAMYKICFQAGSFTADIRIPGSRHMAVKACSRILDLRSTVAADAMAKLEQRDVELRSAFWTDDGHDRLSYDHRRP